MMTLIYHRNEIHFCFVCLLGLRFYVPVNNYGTKEYKISITSGKLKGMISAIVGVPNYCS